MPLTFAATITLDDATLAALRGGGSPVVPVPLPTPTPVPTPAPVPAPALSIPGYTATRVIVLPWGDSARRYSKDVGGLRESDCLVIQFHVPADAAVGKVVSISGAEWIDNGQPREACLSLLPGDWSGTSLGYGSKSEGTSFGVPFVVGPALPFVNVFKPGMPGVRPGQTAYLNVRQRGGAGDTPCNVFVSLK